MKPNAFIWLTLVVAASTWTCSEKIGPGNTPLPAGAAVKVNVSEARLDTFPLIYETVGTVQAEDAGTLSGKLLGTITSIRVREGDRVRAGDVLMTVDERQVGAQRRMAEAALAEARRMEQAAHAAHDSGIAAAGLAAATYQRYEDLFERESVTRQEFEEVRARNTSAQSSLRQTAENRKAAAQRVRQAEAALAAATVSAGDAEVQAPFDGIVTRKMVAVGDLCTPGRPLLGFEKENVHRVDIHFPESYIRMIRPGQTAAVRLGHAAGAPVDGTIVVIAPAADPDSRSFLVKIQIPNVANARSGMFARVETSIGESRLVAVPNTAVVRQGQLTGVFVVTPDNFAHYRLIRTGRGLKDGRVEVISGLSEGTPYIVNPSPAVVDGVRVEAAS